MWLGHALLGEGRSAEPARAVVREGFFLLTTTNTIYGKALPVRNLHAGFVIGVEVACQAKTGNHQAKGVFR